MKDESPIRNGVLTDIVDLKALQCGRSDEQWHKLRREAASFCADMSLEIQRQDQKQLGHVIDCPTCLLHMLEAMNDGILFHVGKDLPEKMIIQLLAMQNVTQRLFDFVRTLPEYRHAKPSRN